MYIISVESGELIVKVDKMVVAEDKYMRVESSEIAQDYTTSKTVYFVMDNNGRDYRSYDNKDTAIEYMNRCVAKGWKK